MSLPLAARIARAEMKGSLGGFAVFLVCLMLGVAAIAAVGTLREAIRGGLSDQGAILLGGDAEMSFSYRFASQSERDWMDARAAQVSEIVDFRSMIVVGEGETSRRALTQVKAVDDAYPLTGAVGLEPAMPLAEALADGGALLDGVLAERLGLKIGDRFRLGLAEFRYAARLLREPDSASAGFGLGPRSIVRTADLAGSGLLEPGTVYETHYRLGLTEGADLARLSRTARTELADQGMSWEDRRRAAPGVERFVERMGDFLVLVGLAGLAVGGVGIAAAVRAYLEGKTETIAILKSLGASGNLILAVYLVQVAALALAGIAAGLALGGALPVLLAPVIEARMPFPVALTLAPKALAEAALYGALTAALFTLWPLSRTRSVRAAALFRDLGPGRREYPKGPILAALILLAGSLVSVAVGFSGVPRLALGTTGGVIGALLVLALAAVALASLARRHAHRARGRPALRAALAAIGGPREEAGAVILSLGLGLTVLAAVGQIDWNLRSAIDRDLPEIAPTFFFVDIQPDQLEGFTTRLEGDTTVARVETAPMLRGLITRINGRPAMEVAGHHWVLHGDRGVTYSASLPETATVTEGEWWPADYAGPPLISFAAEEAEEMRLKLGDVLTVNILGRDIEASIASFREVDFSTAGIGFVMSMNPAALQGAPHSHIATAYARAGAVVDEAAEAAILRDLGGAYPNITAISVREVIGRVTEALTAIARATALAAGATLLTGFAVLIGAAAAGERARVREAAILKTLGATRGQVLTSFALRAAIMGGAAGLVAILFGAAASWAVMTFVMDATYRFEPVSALAIVAGGVTATLVAGLLFALRPLAARPATVLRSRD